MPFVKNAKTGKPTFVSQDQVEAKLASGEVEPLEGQEFGAIGPAGQVQSVAPEKLQRTKDLGGRVATGEEIEEQRLEEQFGDDPLRTGAEGLARGASLGLSDILLQGFGASKRGLRERKERSPTLSTVSEVAGGAIPSLLGGGPSGLAKALKSSPAGIIDDTGKAISKKLGGGVKGAVGRGTVEGGLYGAGATVSEVALSEEPLTTEQIGMSLTSNVLFGAGVGGLAGLGGIALEKTARKAKEITGDTLERLSKPASAADDISDLSKLDRKGLKIAKEAETARLDDVVKQQKTTVADEIRAYQEKRNAANPFLATDDEAARILSDSKRSIRRHVDEPVGLAENPNKALDPLRREATALRRAIDGGDEFLAKLAGEQDTLLKKLSKQLEAGGETVTLQGKMARRYADFAEVKVRRGKSLEIPMEDAKKFQAALGSGEVQGMRAKAHGELQGLLDENLALQQRIQASYKPPASERLTAIDDAFEALSSQKGGKKGLADQLMQGAAYSVGSTIAAPLGPLAPIVGAKIADFMADLGGLTKKLSKAGEKTAERLNTAVDAFLNVTERATRSAPLAATKTLQAVSYGKGEQPLRPMVPTKSRLVENYRQRENELRAQVTTAPDGRVVMRPESRMALGERLSAIAAVSPVAADRIETIAARRVEFLVSRLPKRPDIAAPLAGPDRWQPSDFEMAKFARYAAAVEDPAAILERMNDGTLTPEDAEAMREVYPETYAHVQQQIMERLPELQQTLPYERRLTMSILFGLPVDPAMRPEILTVLQNSFAQNMGGAIAAPSPTGTPRKTSEQEPTAAQKRAG